MLLSHAQNFEDVILWRALGDLPSGQYLDIGAQHPVIDSVSRTFYERGWRGVHVEPSAHYAGLLRADRPQEQVLELALGQAEGRLTFYEFPDTGMSTLDAEIAARHQADGFPCRPTTVEVQTLDRVLSHFKGELHWMKIDVEGAERSALEGWRDSPLRPWVVVIESTLPRLPIPSYQDWEPLLLAKGYRFAYYDGLNRFYVSDQHADLTQKLAVPPNVFDQFAFSRRTTPVFCQDWQQEREAQALRILALQAGQAEQQQALAHSAQQIDQLQGQLQAKQRQLTHTLEQLDRALHTVSDRSSQLRSTLFDIYTQKKELSRLRAVEQSRSYRWSQKLNRRAQHLQKLLPAWLKPERLQGGRTGAPPASSAAQPLQLAFEGWRLRFDEAALVDQRGIGRVSREILGEMLRQAPPQTEAGIDHLPLVHFYSSIHWCPDRLPQPSVVLIHDVIPLLLREHFDRVFVQRWQQRYAAIARQAERIITISHASARDISRELDIDPRRISVVYNGISHLDPNPLTPVDLPQQPFFVYLGAHDQHKNLSIVLHALSDPRCRQMQLVLIGRNESCKDLVQQLGLQDQVHFLGHLHDAEVASVIQQAVALVFPSLYEGFGLPPLEAALLGTPAICSRRPAMTETLQHAALFAEPDAVEEWIDALHKLWSSPELRTQLAAAARVQALKFDWQDSVTALLNVLRPCARLCASTAVPPVPASPPAQDTHASPALAPSLRRDFRRPKR
jgi:FkbM family methyltransferase